MNRIWYRVTIILTIGVLAFGSISVRAQPASTLLDWLSAYCPDCLSKSSRRTGVYVLESGENALLARAWLTERAQATIDVQYFIWEPDNIGILAAEALLAAADRGVRVRVLVDDFLLETENRILANINQHPNVELRIYNPKHHVGVSVIERVYYLFFDFKSFNQRMHDKVAIFDDHVSITGGRNMADEYFDYDSVYNFRDRDVLLAGSVTDKVKENFDEFWNSSLALSIDALVEPSPAERDESFRLELQAYANNPSNFDPKVRERIADVSTRIQAVVDDMVWTDVEFINDAPGKVSTSLDLKTYGRLVEEVSAAQRSILIETPYLIFPEDGNCIVG